MGEDFDFNLVLFFGCIVGAATGYHAGGWIAAVDDCLIGFLASAVSAALLAEVSYAIGGTSAFAARLLDRMIPLLVLGLLLVLARGFWT